MIELIDLHKSFGHKVVFRDVNLKVNRGECVLISGPNGCGKSTLLKIIAGIIKPSSGEVRFSKSLRRIGVMGHFYYVYGELTPVENLNFFSKLYKIDLKEEDILKCLDKVGLKRVCYERTHIFSRGMIQRLNIARLMLLEPDLYLLDEPETGLDKKSKDFFYDFIDGELQKDKTVIWVTHLDGPPFFDLRLVYENKKFIKK